MYGTGYTGKTKMPLSLVFQKNFSFRIDLEITHSILPHLTDFRKCSGNLPSTNPVLIHVPMQKLTVEMSTVVFVRFQTYDRQNCFC